MCYGIGGGGAQRWFLGGQRATLLWDGLGAHRSRAMRAFLSSQRDWLVTERLPAYGLDLNPVEALWSNLKGQELANLTCDSLGEAITAAWQGSSGSARRGGCRTRSCAAPACRWRDHTTTKA